MSKNKVVYDRNGDQEEFDSEDLDISFSQSNVQLTNGSKKVEALGAAALVSLIPSAVDLGFKIANNLLEERKKKFSGEYTIQRSYLEAGKRKVPNITLIRTVTIGNQKKQAIKIVIKAHEVADASAFVYYIESLEVNHSKAKSSRGGGYLDYTIELKPTFFVNGEKKAQVLYPISVNSVPFGRKGAIGENHKYRSDLLPIPKDAFIAEVGIKVVETNPDEVNTEKIIEVLTTYKDDAKTIINNIISATKKDGQLAEV